MEFWRPQAQPIKIQPCQMADRFHGMVLRIAGPSALVVMPLFLLLVVVAVVVVHTLVVAAAQVD